MRARDIKNPFEWLYRGDPAVHVGTANARAACCVTCPLNSQATLASRFTIKAAKIIQRAIEYRLKRKLSTYYDAALGTCSACSCAMVVKVHEPDDLIRKQLTPAVKEKLWDQCWIRRLFNEQTNTKK